MDDIIKQINAESANQELQIQLVKAQKYKAAFEQLVKEIDFCVSMDSYVAWRSLPYVLTYVKESHGIK